MAIHIEDHSLCCGCMACANACPKDAIYTITDENGFLYPQVDPVKCVECGICERVCDFRAKKQAQYPPKEAASLVHCDPKVVLHSTSGGAFTALSDLILQEGGIVVGAAMDGDFTVHHRVAHNTCERDAMRGSLYVQSDIRDSYRAVRQALQNKQKVMFIGTPCQAAGLRSFLGIYDANLLVVEFLCHGVPNNDFLKAHIAWMEQECGKKATGYSFRSKKYGWSPAGIEQVYFQDGSACASLRNQTYAHFFRTNVSLRPSCLQCAYRQWERCSDLTIGDFWGIEKLTEKSPKQGVSFVLANTEQGCAFLQRLNHQGMLHPYAVDDVRFRVSTNPPKSRYDTEEFWSIYRQKGYGALAAHYCGISARKNIRFILKRLRRRILKSQR